MPGVGVRRGRCACRVRPTGCGCVFVVDEERMRRQWRRSKTEKSCGSTRVFVCVGVHTRQQNISFVCVFSFCKQKKTKKRRKEPKNGVLRCLRVRALVLTLARTRDVLAPALPCPPSPSVPSGSHAELRTMTSQPTAMLTTLMTLVRRESERFKCVRLRLRTCW